MLQKQEGDYISVKRYLGIGWRVDASIFPEDQMNRYEK